MTPKLIIIIYAYHSVMDDLTYNLRIAEQPEYRTFDQPRDGDRYATWRRLVSVRYKRALLYLMAVPELVTLITERLLCYLFIVQHKRYLCLEFRGRLLIFVA